MSQTVIVETTTKIPELKTQKQSEKLPDVPSAAHVWTRDTRIGRTYSFLHHAVCWSLFWRLRLDDTNKYTRRQFALFNEEKNGEIKLRKRFKKSNNWCSSIKHRSNKPNMKISVIMVLKDNEWLNLWRNIYSIIDYDEAKERLQKFVGLWVHIYTPNNLYSL